MSLQIANPTVVAKVERLAQATGLSKTAAVEQAVDKRLRELESPLGSGERITALLAQIDQIPDRADPFDPLEWDERGLPR